MNKTGINLTKSENDLLQNNENFKILSPMITKFIEHFYNYCNKMNNEIKQANLKNELLYKDLETIINKNNKLLFHFQLGLFFIIVSILLNIYCLCLLTLN